MSGWPFDYVSVASNLSNLCIRLDSLRKLHNAIAKYEGSEFAVAETDATLSRLARCDPERRASDPRIGTLMDIWHAVELNHYGDRTEQDVTDAFAVHRATLTVAVAQDAPIRHAKTAVKTLPGGADRWPHLVAVIAGAISVALEEDRSLRGDGR